MKRIPSLLLAAVLLLSSGCSLRTTEKTPPTQAPVQTAVPISTPEHTSGPTPVPTPEPCEFTGYRRGEYHLDDISYAPPDYEVFRAEIERIRAMLADGTDSETILEAYEALEEARDSITSADSLISLYSAMDVNDSYYTEQSEWLAAQSSELNLLCTQLDIEIENSPHRDAVFYDWTEEDFRRLRIAEKLYDDDYAALNTRLDELVNDYYTAMANTTFTYDGQEYAQRSWKRWR